MSEESVKEILIHAGLALGIVLAGYIAISVLCKIIQKALKKSKLDEVLHTFVLNSTKVVLWILVAVTALSYAGIPVSKIHNIQNLCFKDAIPENKTFARQSFLPWTCQHLPVSVINSFKKEKFHFPCRILHMT